MSLVVECILYCICGLTIIANIIGSMIMYVSGLDSEMEYRGYDYPNPLSVRCIFIYWWGLFDDLPINIFGKIILITLMTIIFMPMIIIHFVATLVGFIGMWICKLFLFVFKEDLEKKILREAKRELKKEQKRRKGE